MSSSLGRGLQSLIPQKKSNKSKVSPVSRKDNSKREVIFNIEVDKIRASSHQSRKNFAKNSLIELADSIREYGVLQPLLVSKIEKPTERGQDVEYELIAGERRWRAAKMVGLRQVPVIVRNSTADKKMEIGLVENLQRENLNPVELALGFRRLQKEFNLSHQAIAEKIGKDRSTVTNVLRLLTLPPNIKRALSERRIIEGHGRALLKLTLKPDLQRKLFQKILKEKLSMHQANELAKKLSVGIPQSTKAIGPKSLFFRETEKTLGGALGRMVSITQRGRERGKSGFLKIEFRDQEELGELRDSLLKIYSLK